MNNDMDVRVYLTPSTLTYPLVMVLLFVSSASYAYAPSGRITSCRLDARLSRNAARSFFTESRPR